MGLQSEAEAPGRHRQPIALIVRQIEGASANHNGEPGFRSQRDIDCSQWRAEARAVDPVRGRAGVHAQLCDVSRIPRNARESDRASDSGKVRDAVAAGVEAAKKVAVSSDLRRPVVADLNV